MSDKKKKSVKGKNPKPYIPPTQEELDELGSFRPKMEPAKPISEEDAKDLRKLRKNLKSGGTFNGRAIMKKRGGTFKGTF